MQAGLRAAFKIFLLMVVLSLAFGCAENSQESKGQENRDQSGETAGVPLVTLKHWRDSTPGERYSFLIGFVTMLELEKEWQGRVGGQILPFEKSLVSSWNMGLANRPLTEIYNGLNKYLADNPGDLSRPVAEVMWFVYVKPHLDKLEISQRPAEGLPEEARSLGQSQ